MEILNGLRTCEMLLTERSELTLQILKKAFTLLRFYDRSSPKDNVVTFRVVVRD